MGILGAMLLVMKIYAKKPPQFVAEAARGQSLENINE
jgi:hypothetical protein